MTESKTLVLTFSDALGNKMSMTITKPNADLDASTVSAQMDVLVDSKVLGTKFGVVTNKVSAKFVTQVKDSVEMQ